MASFRNQGLAFVAVCAGLALATPARAQSGAASARTSPSAGPDTSTDPRAVELFEKAVAAYRAGDFARSVELLQQAYALRPAPVLLYNLARAYEGLGRIEDAARAYRDYLAQEPKPDDRGAIEKRIATLEAQSAERARLRREKEQGEAAARAAASQERRAPETAPNVAPWIVAGVGGAIVLGGGVVMIVAKGKHDDAKAEPIQLRADEMANDASSLSTLGSIVMLSGAAVAATGVIWALIVPRRSADETTRIGLAPGRATWSVTW